MEKQKHIHIWMPLIGFDRDQPDQGVSQYLNKAGFIPGGMSVFLFHPDIINQHEGMEKEFVLHPDNCSYYGAPSNGIRNRQPWTNYDLRNLAHSLEKNGVEAYMGVMGVYLENSRHQEWESDHLELLSYGAETGNLNLNVLKRFKDGTYYEDFFVEKVTKALVDYGFAGLHVSDFFCPPEHSISEGDFSTDMLEQFRELSGVSYPAHIEARLGHDESEDLLARQQVIWGEMRETWIEFNVERWYRFWKKVCDALHAIGKKVTINNAWCSDPFEALYRYGIDYKKLYEAGIDCIISETVPEGLELADGIGDVFNKLMLVPQLIGAYGEPEKQLCLLGVKDSTEEWDILHHGAPRLDRDIFSLGTNYLKSECLTRSNAGVMVTLGDGITKDEWTTIKSKLKISFGDMPQSIEGATVLWSDEYVHGFLPEYIRTRRPSVHQKMMYFKNNNACLGAISRIDDLANVHNTLLVYDFDLLTPEHQNMVLDYTEAPVICIAAADFKPAKKPDLYFKDEYANYPLAVFAYNVQNFDVTSIEKIFTENTETVSGKEFSDHCFFLVALPCEEMSPAFIKACVHLINAGGTAIFHSEATLNIEKISEKTYRVYIYNSKTHYIRPKVLCDRKIEAVHLIGDYPTSPPQMIVNRSFDEGDRSKDGAKYEMLHRFDPLPSKPDGFVAKVMPSSATVYEIDVE